ncbi:hypothetical protein Poly24_40890 [Rosistilla carotiformis]|uniref:Uncharacterized protein n=1 Tax=Rosistilla carotiformis TaxID=2528017 RepID=A0A518JXU9_9BACT|nr:hypothetical protein [Rosistilla carotiformis]QDV70368.1 hypothetical protein Poly24_40890 [Rosistilla carotiformis]
MAQYDDLDNKQIFAYSAIFVVGTVITIMFVAIIFHWMDEGELRRKMLNTEYTQFNQVLIEQTESLNEYVVVDPVTGRFGIPIENAIEAALKDKPKSDAGTSDEA